MNKFLATSAFFFAAIATLPAQTTVPPATPAPTAAPAPAAPAATTAVAAPNLTGTWKLNVDKSDYGQVPPPTSESTVFTQTGNDLKIATTSDGDRGKEAYTLPITIGGDETPTPKDTFPDDAQFKILSSKAMWDAATLVVDQKMTYQGGAGTIHSVFTLSPDGKTLTRASHYSLDLGEFDVKAVFEKQ